MNHFYVLRSNREAGPFTLAELKAYGLLSTDLVWVDGESKAWRSPAEIQGLDAVSVEEKKPEARPSQQESFAAPKLSQQVVNDAEFYAEAANQELLYGPQSKTVFHRPEKHNTPPPYSIGSRLFGAIVAAFGLFLCGFVVVNMLKKFDEKPAAASSQAVELKNEVLPVSHASHTAEALPSPAPMVTASSIKTTPPATETKDTTINKALLAKPPAKTTDAAAQKAKDKKPLKKPAQKTPPTTIIQEPVAAAPAEEKPEPPKPKEKPSLRLSANDYKKGLFGGISDLQITVANPSDESVAKAVVEVEFLKPNGEVVRTQTVTAENIAAGGSKTIPVPSSGRGVKVRYRVVSIE